MGYGKLLTTLVPQKTQTRRIVQPDIALVKRDFAVVVGRVLRSCRIFFTEAKWVDFYLKDSSTLLIKKFVESFPLYSAHLTLAFFILNSGSYSVGN